MPNPTLFSGQRNTAPLPSSPFAFVLPPADLFPAQDGPKDFAALLALELANHAQAHLAAETNAPSSSSADGLPAEGALPDGLLPDGLSKDGNNTPLLPPQPNGLASPASAPDSFVASLGNTKSAGSTGTGAEGLFKPEPLEPADAPAEDVDDDLAVAPFLLAVDAQPLLHWVPRQTGKLSATYQELMKPEAVSAAATNFTPVEAGSDATQAATSLPPASPMTPLTTPSMASQMTPQIVDASLFSPNFEPRPMTDLPQVAPLPEAAAFDASPPDVAGEPIRITAPLSLDEIKQQAADQLAMKALSAGLSPAGSIEGAIEGSMAPDAIRAEAGERGTAEPAAPISFAQSVMPLVPQATENAAPKSMISASAVPAERLLPPSPLARTPQQSNPFETAPPASTSSASVPASVSASVPASVPASELVTPTETRPTETAPNVAETAGVISPDSRPAAVNQQPHLPDSPALAGQAIPAGPTLAKVPSDAQDTAPAITINPATTHPVTTHLAMTEAEPPALTNSAEPSASASPHLDEPVDRQSSIQFTSAAGQSSPTDQAGRVESQPAPVIAAPSQTSAPVEAPVEVPVISSAPAESTNAPQPNEPLTVEKVTRFSEPVESATVTTAPMFAPSVGDEPREVAAVTLPVVPIDKPMFEPHEELRADYAATDRLAMSREAVLEIFAHPPAQTELAVTPLTPPAVSAASVSGETSMPTAEHVMNLPEAAPVLLEPIQAGPVQAEAIQAKPVQAEFGSVAEPATPSLTTPQVQAVIETPSAPVESNQPAFINTKPGPELVIDDDEAALVQRLPLIVREQAPVEPQPMNSSDELFKVQAKVPETPRMISEPALVADAPTAANVQASTASLTEPTAMQEPPQEPLLALEPDTATRATNVEPDPVKLSDLNVDEPAPESVVTTTAAPAGSFTNVEPDVATKTAEEIIANQNANTGASPGANTEKTTGEPVVPVAAADAFIAPHDRAMPGAGKRDSDEKLSADEPGSDKTSAGVGMLTERQPAALPNDGQPTTSAPVLLAGNMMNAAQQVAPRPVSSAASSSRFGGLGSKVRAYVKPEASPTVAAPETSALPLDIAGEAPGLSVPVPSAVLNAAESRVNIEQKPVAAQSPGQLNELLMAPVTSDEPLHTGLLAQQGTAEAAGVGNLAPVRPPHESALSEQGISAGEELNFVGPQMAETRGTQVAVKEIAEAETPVPVAKQLAQPMVTASEQLTPDEPKTLRLKLRPEELGQVEIELTRDVAGRLHAHLTVEHEQAHRVLRDELGQLRAALEHAGWQVEQLAVSTQPAQSGWNAEGQSPAQSEQPYLPGASGTEPLDTEPASNGGLPTAQDRLLNLHA